MPSRSPRLLAGALLFALLTACSTAAPTPETAATRTVETERGTVEVPAVPQSIVALDEYAALNALSVGVRPTTVFGGLSSQVGAAVLGAEGIAVTPAPTMITQPDLEAIAAARPDVIVLTSSGTVLDTTYPQLSAIAPTVVLPFEGPWQDPIRTAGAAFGADDRASALVDAVQERIDTLAARPGGSLAILASFQGLLYSPAPANPGSALVAAAGLTRPQAELGAASGASASTIPVSAESLGAHDADHVLVLDGSIYDPDAVTSLPTFAALPAVQAGRTARVDGEMWSGGTALSTWWVLDDLEALAQGRAPATAADAPAKSSALDTASR